MHAILCTVVICVPCIRISFRVNVVLNNKYCHLEDYNMFHCMHFFLILFHTIYGGHLEFRHFDGNALGLASGTNEFGISRSKPYRNHQELIKNLKSNVTLLYLAAILDSAILTETLKVQRLALNEFGISRSKPYKNYQETLYIYEKEVS